MKNHFWDRRIPTFLGIIFLSIAIGITTFLVKQGGLFSITATPAHDPKDVRITNITDNSFTISYFTQDNTSGVINYGDSPSLGKSVLDDKDQQSANVSSHSLHNFTVNNLIPSTKYYFSIISGQDTYTNSSGPFEIITGQKINDLPFDQSSITGTVLLPTSDPPKEAIIYLTTSNAQVISALLKSDGTFTLSLNSLRNSSLSSYFKIETDAILKLLVVGDKLTSNIVLSPPQINPVPTITLSNDYDFTVSISPIASSSASNNTFPSFESNTTSEAKNPQILTPQKSRLRGHPAKISQEFLYLSPRSAQA